MKKMISLLMMLILAAMPLVALAYSYSGNTCYAGWYQVYRTNNCLAINDKPAASSNRDVSIVYYGAVNGTYVHLESAQAGAGTAKKWGKVDMIYINGQTVSVSGYGCMYYLKKASSPIPDNNTCPSPSARVVTVNLLYILLFFLFLSVSSYSSCFSLKLFGADL